MSHCIGWARNVSVAPDGKGLVGHAGAAQLRALADRTELTGALSAALGKPFDQRRDRGVVLVETAMTLVLGGTDDSRRAPSIRRRSASWSRTARWSWGVFVGAYRSRWVRRAASRRALAAGASRPMRWASRVTSTERTCSA